MFKTNVKITNPFLFENFLAVETILFVRSVKVEQRSQENKKLYFALSLFTQVYKWVPAIIMLGGNLAIDYNPIQGE